MNIKRGSYRSSKKEKENMGDHEKQGSLEDNKVPPLEEVVMGDQVPVISPTNGRWGDKGIFSQLCSIHEFSS